MAGKKPNKQKSLLVFPALVSQVYSCCGIGKSPLQYNHHLTEVSQCLLQSSYVYCTFPQHLALSIIFRANSFPVDLQNNQRKAIESRQSQIRQRHPLGLPPQTQGGKTASSAHQWQCSLGSGRKVPPKRKKKIQSHTANLLSYILSWNN